MFNCRLSDWSNSEIRDKIGFNDWNKHKTGVCFVQRQPWAIWQHYELSRQQSLVAVQTLASCIKVGFHTHKHTHAVCGTLLAECKFHWLLNREQALQPGPIMGIDVVRKASNSIRGGASFIPPKMTLWHKKQEINFLGQKLLRSSTLWGPFLV